MIEVIKANWPAPAHVQAVTTTRIGGVSDVPFASLNVATHVGDRQHQVLTNREILHTQLRLPTTPCWLQQVHGVAVAKAQSYSAPPIADAAYTTMVNQVCAVLTADCLPILICDQQGTQVAAIHAGWRSLVAGIIGQTLLHFPQPSAELLVWFGPAIGPTAFEVGVEVYEQFLQLDNETARAFTPSPRRQRWYADIYQLAALQLRQRQVTKIYGGTHCTYHDARLFYSHRRDGQKTGRMASLIWLAAEMGS